MTMLVSSLLSMDQDFLFRLSLIEDIKKGSNRTIPFASLASPVLLATDKEIQSKSLMFIVMILLTLKKNSEDLSLIISVKKDD